MADFVSQLSVLLFLTVTGGIIYFVCGSLGRKEYREYNEYQEEEKQQHRTQIMGLWRAEILDENGTVIRTVEIPDVQDQGFYIGRDPENDLCLADDYISQEHAVIGSDARGFFLKDCQSKNGTYYQNRRIKTVDLKDHMIVYFGKTPCRFVKVNLLECFVEEEQNFTKVWDQEVQYECFNRQNG